MTTSVVTVTMGETAAEEDLEPETVLDAWPEVAGVAGVAGEEALEEVLEPDAVLDALVEEALIPWLVVVEDPPLL